ncbi:MAG: type IV pilus secretin PilQ [Proteobacteria bacterium]|uniref:type IV pilus secretin PilQ n=1 Tax=Rudaea sp. TaxID=2136325 RepID=UPI00378478E0|nr:type IV pilus secretin PilQ [Pseudomonadota bacterium]
MKWIIAGAIQRTAAQRFGAAFGVLLASFFAVPAAHAENVLQDIGYAPLAGGRVQITLKLAAPPAGARAFTTETPPRIALDFPDTRSTLSQRHIEVGSGATSGINVADAGGRTRVVVDLYRASTYETRADGNNFVLVVNNGNTANASATIAAGDQTKSVGQTTQEVSNIDFRRGKNGEGRIVITFSGEGSSADLKRQGDRILLDIFNARLPTQLAQRLDVLDFATPVQFIETRSKGGGAHMEITAKPPFEQLAYQTGNQYIVEVAPAKEKEKKDPNAPPVYSGSRVTFDFQDIPTRAVLQLIAQMSELNIVVADSVTGNVTLRLNNVPWDQALDIVLQAKGLDKRQNGNVIWVAPQKEIADREQAIADAKLKLEQVSETITEYIPISYGKAKDIADLLTQKSKQGNQGGGGGAGTQANASGFLSERGRVSYDERTNTLLVVDTPEKVRSIRELVVKLDKPVQQVLIEARVVVATDNFSRELGAKFGISGATTVGSNVVSTSGNLNGSQYMTNQALANRLATGDPFPVLPPGVSGGTATGTSNLGDRLNVNLPTSTTNAGSIGLSVLGANVLLDLELSAGQTEGRSELISSPRVVTSNQQEANITQGQEIPYSTITSSGGGNSLPTVAFKDAVLGLKVTPTITADGRVFLNLDVKKDALAGYYTNVTGSYPIIDKREMTTSVLVDNGQTVVLGGVYEFDKQDAVTKVPFLGDLPGLGAFFRNVKKSNQKAELLIFVTPKILDENLR